jgi:hypothetical protein
VNYAFTDNKPSQELYCPNDFNLQTTDQIHALFFIAIETKNSKGQVYLSGM